MYLKLDLSAFYTHAYVFLLYQELRIQFYIAFNLGHAYWLPWEPQKQNEMKEISGRRKLVKKKKELLQCFDRITE